MPFEYSLDKVNKMGDFDPKYGQSYWAEVGQGEKPIMFNSMDQTISDGAKIEAEERVEKRSQKGTDYYRLKKVKVTEKGVVGQYPEQGTPPQGLVYANIDPNLVRMIKEIHESVVGTPKPEDKLPTDAEVMGGEIEPDLSSIPF
jgi:hypothetical protein